MFLQTALSIIEGNGTFREFAIKIGLIILGKIAIDLFSYYVFHPVREKFEIKCESYLNAMIFKKAQQVELGCYEDPDFFDNYNRATWVVEKGGFTTKDAAYKAGVAAYNDYLHGNIGITSERVTLKDFMSAWLQNVVAVNVKPTSL